jgi:MFS family permease
MVEPTQAPTPEELHQAGLLCANLLSEARQELERADAKALGLLQFFGLVVGVVLAGVLAGTWSPASLDSWRVGLFWLGAGAVAGSLVVLCAAIWPRVSKRNLGEDNYLDYFGDITDKMDNAEIIRELARSNRDARNRDAAQFRTISLIAQHKYHLTSIATGLFGAGAVLISLAVVV